MFTSLRMTKGKRFFTWALVILMVGVSGYLINYLIFNPTCVSGYVVQEVPNPYDGTFAQECIPIGVTLDESSLTSSEGNPFLSGDAGVITDGSDLYVAVYGDGEKQWGSGVSHPIVVDGRWSIRVGSPDASFSLPLGKYDVRVWYGLAIIASGTLRIIQ